MTTLYLARHGETVDNVNNIMQGQTPGKLNENGIAQAHELAAAMEGTHFDAFMASDLKRAVDTCRIVAAPHGMDVDTTPLLRERDWGSFTGRPIPNLATEEWPDDIETIGEMKERARQFLRLVSKKYPGKVVFAVGHGIINKAVQAVFYGKDIKEIKRMENAEVRVLELP